MNSMPNEIKIIDRTRSVRAYAFAVIFFGIYNLLGTGNFQSFAMMFKGVSVLGVWCIYVFTVFYGICDVYCGTRIMRLEDWARKVAVFVTFVNVVLSFVFNKTVFANFRIFLDSGKAGIAADKVPSLYKYAVILAALVTLFEISVVFYFTRPSVKKMFRGE
jgi:hypothetical protein